MQSYQIMDRHKEYSGIYSVNSCRIGEAFGPYRQAFLFGDVQQQNVVMNEFVSSLLSAESAKIAKQMKFYNRSVKSLCQLEETFTCDLCQDLLHCPITLICGHTFCVECLENYRNQGRTMCPDCGRESSLEYQSANIVVRDLSHLWFPEKTYIRNCIIKANKLLQNGKIEEFMELLQELLTKTPENLDLLFLRANGYKYAKRYSDALEDLNFACSIDPFCSKVLYRRGEILDQLGNPEEAMEMFLRASALKPNDPTYRLRLISCLEKLLKNICDSEISGYPSAAFGIADYNSKPKRVIEGLPIQTEANFQEFLITQRNVSSEDIEAHETEHDKNAATTNLDGHDGSEPPDRRSEQTSRTCRKNSTENRTDTFVEEDSSCRELGYKTKDAKNVSEIQGQTQRRNLSHQPTTDIPSELECKLCFNLMFDPITTPCGHSFCRPCLSRCLDHRFVCPCCRTNLQSYLEQLVKGAVGTCKILEKTLQLKFKDDYHNRRITYENELFEFSSCESGENEIPIFVCTLAVPGIACPLHVFEPRYKLMIRRCLDSGSRQFGMCVSDPEHGFASAGTMLFINNVNFLPDGRSVIHTVGTRRFKVLERGLRDGYNTAKIAWLEDERDEPDCTDLNYEVYAMMVQWFRKLPCDQQTCIVKAVGQIPGPQHGTDENGPSWLWWLLVAMPLNSEAKRIILSMTSVTERLISSKRFLALLLSKQ